LDIPVQFNGNAVDLAHGGRFGGPLTDHVGHSVSAPDRELLH
jgi:hypothetical protein